MRKYIGKLSKDNIKTLDVMTNGTSVIFDGKEKDNVEITYVPTGEVFMSWESAIEHDQSIT